MSTKTYRVFIKKNNQKAILDLELLQNGFNLNVMFFQIFFLLKQKLFKEFSVILLIDLFLLSLFCFAGFNYIILLILYVLLNSYISISYNIWKTKYMKKNNYEYIGIISGENEKNAKDTFLDSFNNNYKKEDKLEKKIF